MITYIIKFNKLRLAGLPGGGEKLGRKHTCKQGFGSGSGLDPDSIRSVNPDPDPGGQK